jgi:sugar transferase (PEP-CTERM/EpsH1 system associated)
MRILFLSRWFPFPPDNGSKIRIFNLIKALSTRHDVELISFAGEAVGDDQLMAMHRYCRKVDVALYRSFQPHRLRALMGFFSPKPRSVLDTHNVDLQALVDEAANGKPFDVVIASQIDMAPYAATIADCSRVFEELELATLYEQFARSSDTLMRLRYQLTWLKSSSYIARLLPKFDACTVASAQERDLISRLMPRYKAIDVIPNGVDVAHHRAEFDPPQAETVIYSGALSYQANFDAVDYFLREVFPLIQKVRPNAKFYVTGKADPALVSRLPPNDGVIFTGYLKDVRPQIANSWVSVAPLRVGGGTRLKVLEALALGTPVVATSKGAEGLSLTPGRDVLIANAPAEFAGAVLRVLGDPTLREVLSRNGRQTVAAQYDWQQIGQRFTELIETVVAQKRSNSMARFYGSA